MDYIMSPSNCMDNIKESLHGYTISQSLHECCVVT